MTVLRDCWHGCYDDSWKGLIVEEAWRPIVGLESRYEILTLGRIRTLIGIGCLKRGSILKCSRNAKGYVRIRLSGQNRTSVVHRLVLETFVGPCPSPQHECNHKNGRKDDNRLENLEWVTRKENNRHAVTTGLWKPHIGEAHGRALLTFDDVVAIRGVEGILSAVAVGRCYRVNPQTVRSIWKRRNWKHVT